MHARAFDIAGFRHNSHLSPYLMLPSASLTASASRTKRFRCSISWPACAPVNASPIASRLYTHDSGSAWGASPSP
jgi:hypothetical protein